MGRITPKYVAIEPWIWKDSRVRSLSQEARGLFGLLMSAPQMTKIPGLLDAGTGALKDEWNGSEEEFCRVFAQIEAAGLAVADWHKRLVYIPPMLNDMVCNRPTAIGQASAYGTIVFVETPDCELIRRVDHDLRRLMLNSPALMTSYLHCRPMTNADASRVASRPIPSQPRQASLDFSQAGAPDVMDSEADAGQEPGDAGEEPGDAGAESDASPALTLVQGGDPDAELAAGMELLVERAGPALRLEATGWSPAQQHHLSLAWLELYEAGWRCEDLGALGGFVAANGFYWLKRITPAMYIASRLGEALTKMVEKTPQKAAPPPRHPRGSPGGKLRLKWSLDRFGRPDGVEDGVDRFRAIIDDAWDLEQLDLLYARYMAGEDISVAQVKEALAAERRPDRAIIAQIERMHHNGAANTA